MSFKVCARFIAAGVLLLGAAPASSSPSPGSIAQRDRFANEAGGTSSLAGIVQTDTSAPAPVRGALVTISADELPAGRATLTDADGRFRFDGLPAGRFVVTASKAPFITAAFGAKRSGTAGTAITVAAGQRLEDVVVRLSRGAVIAGQLRDAAGEPVPAVQVAALRVDFARGTSPAPVAQTTMTDDRGAYRLFGLMPGKYAIVSTRSVTSGELSRPTAADLDAALAELQAREGRPSPSGGRPPVEPARRWPTVGVAPIYYPGTAQASELTPVSVIAGEERSGVDFTVSVVPTTTIQGTIVHPEGSPASVLLVIAPADSVLPLLAMLTPVLTPPDTEGRFKYTNVAPGTYTITARSGAGAPATTTRVGSGGGAGGGIGPPPSPTAGRVLWAMSDVTVAGADVAGVTLALQPAMRVTGKIVFDPGKRDPPADLTQLSVRLTSTRSRGSAAINSTVLGSINVPPAAVRADGSFEVGGVLPGSYQLAVAGAAADWWLRSAVTGGRDLLDTGLEFGRAGDVNGVTLTLTDRRSELSGTLQTPTGVPAAGYVVVVFPANRELWTPQSRRVKFVRPADDGTFGFRDLPAGEYLMAALADLDPPALDDPAFLDQLLGASVKVRINDGQPHTQHLRIGG